MAKFNISDKNSKQSGYRGNARNIIRPYMTGRQLTSYSMMESLKLSLMIRNKTRMPTLTTLIQGSIGIVARAIRQEEEVKGLQIGRKR